MATLSNIVIRNKAKLGVHIKDTSLPQDLYFRLSSSWKDWYESIAKEYITCGRCGIYYREIENIGAWKCKQHALEWNRFASGEFRERGRYDCCGSIFIEDLSEFPKGCVPADHAPLNTVHESPREEVVFPQILLPYMIDIKREAILDGPELNEFLALNPHIPNDCTVVRRFSTKEHLSRINRGKGAEEEDMIDGNFMRKKDTSWFGI
jgi:hypothetical protein